MDLDVTEIRSKLYIGSVEAAANTKSLSLIGVTHVLSVGAEFPARLAIPHLEDEKHVRKRKLDGRSCGGRVYLQDAGKKDPFVRLFIPVDSGTEDIAQHFDDGRLFISEGLAQGRVLVHCADGRSRSVIMVAA